MKNIVKFFAALAALSACVSCNKSIRPGDAGEPCVLNVTLGGEFGRLASTKAPGDDERINSVQILVFNTLTGKLDGAVYKDGLHGYGQWTSQERINCTTGPRQVFAIVNAAHNYVDGESAVSRLSEMSALATVLSDNSASNLVMSGSSPVQTFTAPVQNITVDVSRICASVVLKEVSNQMYSPVYKDRVRLAGAYLMNVPGENLLVGESVSAATVQEGKWYARNTKESSSDVASLLCAEYSGSSALLPYGEATALGTVFYTMPNDLAVEAAEPWRQSSTYLVVEAEIDGNPCVYPVRLNALESNRRYEVSLVLHRVGGDPDEPFKEIEFADVTPTIVVTDWVEGTPINQEI